MKISFLTIPKDIGVYYPKYGVRVLRPFFGFGRAYKYEPRLQVRFRDTILCIVTSTIAAYIVSIVLLIIHATQPEYYYDVFFLILLI